MTNIINKKIAMAVGRYELEPYYSTDGVEKFHYVIEIFCRNSAQFYPRVHRYDFFKMQPSFGMAAESEEEMLVCDDTEDWQKIEGTSIDAVLSQVLTIIEQKFV